MRTMYVLALVSSLLAAGCCTTGTNCGGGWTNDCGAGTGCATGDCGTSTNFSDYNFDCGPMCGAYVSDDQTSSPVTCDANCQVGNARMPGYLANAAANMGGRMADMKGRLASGVCKGLGSTVGCIGCRDCGGSAVGLNNSGSSGSIGGCGGKGCGCESCLASKLLSPFKANIPHTANAAGFGGGATGFGGGGSAPSYAYPYYTTRGPRDFLQDGCGPPPIYPSNPRPNCLPTIGG